VSRADFSRSMQWQLTPCGGPFNAVNPGTAGPQRTSA